ncbi:hypothetical protein MCOR02_008358 [Pyricularia oryzae]|nr:hypothetical protein MCOR02_008358 [Pyricularia oryzae]KAI6312288.1 hypothetical protein MCOR34_005652 [Pyricularia oryzae]KAI6466794.1 hypothetical protein MCOR17_004695 [Pyricularia oryzae]KAI6480081.1 hypothetical protein MCOR13_011226 [Pyricularia oryzae]KAI6583418.1 hypothetical protein MCOR04_005077 [Pyricularia oryzae]
MAPHLRLQPTANSEPSIKLPITKPIESTPNLMSPSLTGPQPHLAAPTNNVGVAEAVVSQPNATEPKQRVKMKRTSGIQAARIGHALKTSATTSALSHGMHRPLPGKQSASVHGISGRNVRKSRLSPARRSPARINSDLTDEDEDEVRSTSARSSHLGKRDRNSSDDSESETVELNVKKIKGSTLPEPLLEDTHGRPYVIYEGDFGRTDTRGALIPEGYITGTKDHKVTWPCPVRGCSLDLESLTALGDHFSRSHRSTTFNDNRDGSLSKLGTYGRHEENLPGIVVSQVPQTTDSTDFTRMNNGGSIKPNEPRFTDSPGYRYPTPSIENGLASSLNGAKVNQCTSKGHLNALRPEIISATRQQANSSRLKQKYHGKLDTLFKERERNLKEDFQLRNYSPSQRTSAVASTSEGSTPAPIHDQATVTSQRSPVAMAAKLTRKAVETPIPIPTAGQRVVHQAKLPDDLAETASLAKTIAPTNISKNRETDSFNLPSGNAESAWKFCLKYIQNDEHKRSIPDRQYVKEFLQMPFVREMQWNELWLKDHPWKDSCPRDISSLLMHRSGEVSPNPCERCSRKLGPYSGCITIPLGLCPATQSMIYSCSNCLYHSSQRLCSLQPQLKSEFQLRFPDFDRKQEKVLMQTHLENDNRVTSPELIDPDPPSSASPETVVNRSRGPPINYNIKRLSKSSMGAGRSKDSRARSREAPDPLNEDDEEPHASPKLQRPTNSEFGINSASGRKVSHVPLPSRLQSKGSGVPNGAASAHSAANSAPAINAPAKELDEKMETWEVGPGFVRNEESDKIAFSTAYLNGLSSVRIADGVSCRLEFLKAGCSRNFDSENTLRICWVSSGKVEVELDGKKFSVGGPGGILKLNKGAKAVVSNNRYIDACLQITAVAIED